MCFIKTIEMLKFKYFIFDIQNSMLNDHEVSEYV